jgi:hypothetical protein
MFCRDSEGRVWIAGIDIADSPLKTIGTRKRVVNAGKLTMPAFEYTSQAKDYNPPRVPNGNVGYGDMWPVFHSKIPLIKRYLAAKAA